MTVKKKDEKKKRKRKKGKKRGKITKRKELKRKKRKLGSSRTQICDLKWTHFTNKSIVSSRATLTHDGGGNSNAIANMVKYTLQQYNGDPTKVFVTGTSSGGMMTVSYLLPELTCVCLIMGQNRTSWLLPTPTFLLQASSTPAPQLAASIPSLVAPTPGTAPVLKAKFVRHRRFGQRWSLMPTQDMKDPDPRCRSTTALPTQLSTRTTTTRRLSNGQVYSAWIPRSQMSPKRTPPRAGTPRIRGTTES